MGIGFEFLAGGGEKGEGDGTARHDTVPGPAVACGGRDGPVPVPCAKASAVPERPSRAGQHLGDVIFFGDQDQDLDLDLGIGLEGLLMDS